MASPSASPIPSVRANERVGGHRRMYWTAATTARVFVYLRRHSIAWEGGVRIDQACGEFLRDCANVRKLSEHTTRAYRLDLARFTRFAGPQKEVTSFDRTVLPQYVEHLFAEHHLKETSAKRHVASVRSLFRWLEDGGHVAEDPFRA